MCRPLAQPLVPWRRFWPFSGPLWTRTRTLSLETILARSPNPTNYLTSIISSSRYGWSQCEVKSKALLKDQVPKLNEWQCHCVLVVVVFLQRLSNRGTPWHSKYHHRHSRPQHARLGLRIAAVKAIGYFLFFILMEVRITHSMGATVVIVPGANATVIRAGAHWHLCGFRLRPSGYQIESFAVHACASLSSSQ